MELTINKNTILTIMYTIVDDSMKSSPVIQDTLTRPGPDPECPDSAIVTVSLYQELIGEPREDHFYRLHEKELRSFFPNLPERSRYHRRKKDLWSIILALRVILLVMLKAFTVEVGATDSAPVPTVGRKRDKRSSRFHQGSYGYCSSKAMKYFGYKFHSLVSLTGIIIDFCLTGAAPYDNQVVVEFLGRHQEQIRLALGDKAYNDHDLQTYLEEHLNLILWAPKKKNQKQQVTNLDKTKSRMRLMVEIVNAQVQEQFHLTKHYAKSEWGLFTRIASKITAHTLGIIINKILGRPPLALAGLAV